MPGPGVVPLPPGLPAGQTTLVASLNNPLSLARPPPNPRPGPKPQQSRRSTNTVFGRRLVGGVNEQSVLMQFAQQRLAETSDGEEGDIELVNRTLEQVEDFEETDDNTNDYVTRNRYSYTREHKLMAIDYFQTTWRKGKGAEAEYVRLSIRYAARKLRITRKMLRSWVANKDKIEAQKKGSRRSRLPWKDVKEEEMELRLNNRFEEAREAGRLITAKWFLRHARDLYMSIHPDRVIQRTGTIRTFLGFRFSKNWLRGFKRRYNISLRAGTKRAQKAPKELAPTIQKWLQFNRQQSVVREDSIYGIPHGPSIPTIGRFKLSEIANMDQSPLPWETLKGRTYAKKGEKTIRLKGAKSGWEKRQCTLQICVFADGIERCKPLLMFQGQTTSKDRRRKAEAQKYHPGVVVIFNPKGYANTDNLIQWVQNQYSKASAYPLHEHEPRLLSLDAFAPHKNKRSDPKKKLSPAGMKAKILEEKKQELLRQHFRRLNTTLSIIPGGCTGYVQVLDISINKLLKQFIAKYEDAYIDTYIEQWKAGNYTVSDRRILMTHWVAQAWERLHKEHKDLIIKTFRNVGLSLNVDGSEDHLLKIKDLEGLIIGDYNLGTSADGAIELEEGETTIVVEEVAETIYITGAEAANGVSFTVENPNDVTTDLGDDTERFDINSEVDEGSDSDMEYGGD